MSNKHLFLFVVAASIAALNIAPASAAPPTMKMTTPVPPGITTPDTVETSIGTLQSFDGVPTRETAQKVFDHLDLVRAINAYLSGIQVASMEGLRLGYAEVGPPNTTVQVYQNLMDSKALWLTPNTTSVYFAMWLELADEPMVMETPPRVLGLVDDHWFKYVTDFGLAGPDKGQGGKFLFVPPGYEGRLPDGDEYFVVHTPTYGNWVAWRGFQVDGDPAPAVAATKEHFRVYPLSQKDTPPDMNFVEMSGVFNSTIHRMDSHIFNEIDNVVQSEPPEGQDPEILGLFASIGIRKGEEFAPDERLQAILEDAANIAAVTVRGLTAYPRDDSFYYFPGESYWVSPFVGGSYEFLNDGIRLLDARAFFHFYATGITPAMAAAQVGIGSQYGVLYLDEDGEPLDGSKTYSITLPPDIPAKDFWSFTLYDNQTRSQLQTDQRLPGIDNSKGEIPKNENGSTTIYFGPTAPEGKEANWVQTVPEKGWNVILRLYGPLESWFDKSWRPGEAVLVE